METTGLTYWEKGTAKGQPEVQEAIARAMDTAGGPGIKVAGKRKYADRRHQLEASAAPGRDPEQGAA
jgi:hypothetical protein